MNLYNAEIQDKKNKLINYNQKMLYNNNNLIIEIKKLKDEILILKNDDKKNINILDNNEKQKNIKFIKEINKLKEKLINYEIENNKLKTLLRKNNNEKQYINSFARMQLKNSFSNYSIKNKGLKNYREYNKSVSPSKIKINLDIPISKSYEEDKDIKYIN